MLIGMKMRRLGAGSMKTCGGNAWRGLDPAQVILVRGLDHVRPHKMRVAD